MRYALLLSYKESAAEAPEKDTLASLDRFAEQARARLVSVVRLLPAWSATCVRVRDGGLVIEDGPFAETEEQIGGLLVVECADLDEAIELASQVPVAQAGTVEIRPVSEP